VSAFGGRHEVQPALAPYGLDRRELRRSGKWGRVGAGLDGLPERLEEAQVPASHLERHPDPHDGHARIVRLTDRGRALQAAAHDTSRTLEAAWADSLGEERFAVLRATLQDMIAAGELRSSSMPGC
jgi:hypothetical protein